MRGRSAPRARARRARGRHAVPGSDQVHLALRLDDTSAHLSSAHGSGGQTRLGRGDREPEGPGASLALGARLAARKSHFDEARSLIEEAGALFGALGVEVAVTAAACGRARSRSSPTTSDGDAPTARARASRPGGDRFMLAEIRTASAASSTRAAITTRRAGSCSSPSEIAQTATTPGLLALGAARELARGGRSRSGQVRPRGRRARRGERQSSSEVQSGRRPRPCPPCGWASQGGDSVGRGAVRLRERKGEPIAAEGTLTARATKRDRGRVRRERWSAAAPLQRELTAPAPGGGVREDVRRRWSPVGSLDSVPSSLERQQPCTGISPASASPCSRGNVGSSMPWITGVGTAMVDAARAASRPRRPGRGSRRPRCYARAQRRGGRAVRRSLVEPARPPGQHARVGHHTRSPTSRPTSPQSRSSRTARTAP